MKLHSHIYLKDSLPQGSVLAPLLFNLYTLPTLQSQSLQCLFMTTILLLQPNTELHLIETILTDDLKILKENFYYML